MYQIVTDSCCDLPYDILEKEKIKTISMEIIINEDVFLDDGGKTFDMDKFYDELKLGALPSTSQVNVSRYIDFFTPYVKENIPVLYLSFSSGLSGSYQSALLAVEIIKEDFPECKIYIFDTLAASGGQALILLDAIHNQNNGFSLEDNINWLEKNKMNYQHWCTVDDLNHLYHGGRITKSAAAVGELLSVKPIIVMDKQGKLVVHHKVRTRKKSLRYLADQVIKSLKQMQDPSKEKVIIMHAGDIETAEQIKQLILKEVSLEGIFIYNLGPTIASHTGYGCIAIFNRGNVRTH